MNDDFAPFELAVKLKEKGFDEECLAYYTSEHTLYTNKVVLCDDKYLEVAEIDYEECLRSYNTQKDRLLRTIVDAPTISQVLKWLREKYFIHISTKPYPCEDGIMWLYETRKFNEYRSVVVANKTGFIKEEKAALAGIKCVLDNLI